MADGRQILEIVMGGSGGARGGVGAEGKSEPGGSNPLASIAKKLGVSQKKDKDTAEATTGMAKGMGNFVKNQLGISFSLANILKQSQIFTSFVGSIFQIMGALVDVILAPFLPILIPIIQKIGGWIPWVQVKAQEIANGLFTFFSWLGGAWSGAVAIWDKVNNLLEPIKGWISSVKGFVEKWTEDLTIANIVIAITRIWETAGAKIVSIVDGLWTKIRNVWNATQKVLDDVPTKIWNLVWIGLKWVGRTLTTLLDNAVKLILGAMPGGSILKLLYAFAKNTAKFFGNMALSLAKLLLRTGKWFITEAVPFLVRGLKTLLGKILNPIWEVIKKVGAKIPFVGKAFKNLDNLPMVGKALKRVPVLGTVAQLGFGAYETIQATRKYGMQAGVEFGLKNVAAAGVGLLDAVAPGVGTVAAAGIDIGGTIALERRWQQKMLEKEQLTTVNVTLNNEGGTVQEETFVAQGNQVSDIQEANAYLSGRR